MELTLDALTEHRNQINVQIEENYQKNKADIDARFPNKSYSEKFLLMFAPDNALNNQNKQLRKELAVIDSQIELAKKELPKAIWKNAVSKLNGKAEKIIDSLKVQVTPSAICVEPNDAFIKRLFLIGPKSFKQALQGRKFSVREKRQTAKKDAIYSHLKVTNADGYEDDTPLDEFDRAVLGVIISEYLAGNRYTTVNIIFRALIGKVGDRGAILRKNQQDSIINSVIKLMATLVDFSSVAESLQEMKYTDKDGNEITLRSSNLLSADIIDAKINGQVIEGVIFFKANSPLFDIANAKNQIIRYPHALLNVPNQNNTPRIIALKKYVIRRICEIKLHHMTPAITFDDVFQKCRMLDSPRKIKLDARNAIVNLFQYLKDKNFISHFELIKKRLTFISIKFAYFQK